MQTLHHRLWRSHGSREHTPTRPTVSALPRERSAQGPGGATTSHSTVVQQRPPVTVSQPPGGYGEGGGRHENDGSRQKRSDRIHSHVGRSHGYQNNHQPGNGTRPFSGFTGQRSSYIVYSDYPYAQPPQPSYPPQQHGRYEPNDPFKSSLDKSIRNMFARKRMNDIINPNIPNASSYPQEVILYPSRRHHHHHHHHRRYGIRSSSSSTQIRRQSPPTIESGRSGEHRRRRRSHSPIDHTPRTPSRGRSRSRRPIARSRARPPVQTTIQLPVRPPPPNQVPIPISTPQSPHLYIPSHPQQRSSYKPNDPYKFFPGQNIRNARENRQGMNDTVILNGSSYPHEVMYPSSRRYHHHHHRRHIHDGVRSSSSFQRRHRSHSSSRSPRPIVIKPSPSGGHRRRSRSNPIPGRGRSRSRSRRPISRRPTPPTIPIIVPPSVRAPSPPRAPISISTSQRPDVRLQTAIADPQPSDARPVTVSVVVQPGDPPGAPPRRRQSAGPVSMSSERQPGFLPRPQRERSRSYFPSPHSHRAYSPYPYHHPSRSISSRRRRSSTSTLSAPRHAHHISRSPSPVGWYGSRPYGPSRYHVPGPTVVPVQAVVEPSYSYYNAAYPQTPGYNYPQTSGYNYTQTPDYNYFDWHKIAAGSYIYAFLLDTLPNQVYLHLLLRLPQLYFSRVTKIFEEADLSIPEIKNMVMEAARQGQDVSRGFTKLETVPDPPFANLKNMWETFIDSLMEEWRTLNIVSVLLLSAILTILQIDSAGTDPLTRYSALISLICALMSLLYGCMYIIRFGTMRKTHKAAVWASEGEDQKNFRIWWNVWVFLAMPAVWLAWSLILYIVCIMSFVWRAGIVSGEETVLVTSRDVLWPRIVISVVLGIGCIYFVLIISTLREYGDKMDNKWLETVRIWTNADSKITPTVPLVYPSYKSRSRSHSTSERRYSSTSPSRKTSSTPSMNTNRSSSSPSKSPTRSPDIPIIMTRAPLSSAKKVISKYSGTLSIPQEIRDCGLTDKEWDDLVLDVKAVHENINERKLQTQDETETRLQKNIAYLLRAWNRRTLSKYGLQAITLESEENNPDDIGGPFPAVYIADLPYVGDDEKKYSQARY